MKRPLLSLLAALALPLAACDACAPPPAADPLEGLARDRTVPLPAELTGSVEVLRDGFGAPHIFCQELVSCSYAQGFVEAHDRFFQMEFFRRVGSGSLGHLLGSFPQVRAVDRHYRRFLSGPEGQALNTFKAERLLPDERAHLEAYTAGVNAYLEALLVDNTLPVPDVYEHSFILGGAEIIEGLATPAPWKIEDSVAVMNFISFALSDHYGRELGAAQLVGALPPAQAAALFPLAPLDPTFVVPDFFGAQPLRGPGPPGLPELSHLAGAGPLLGAALAGHQAMGPYGQLLGDPPGSNNWVLGPSVTTSGVAIVANDPHLTLMSPSFVNEVHLDSVSLPGATGKTKASGFTFVGVPGVVLGHTQSMAWAGTVAGFDVMDFYLEEVSGVDTVRFKGQDVAVIKHLAQYRTGPNPTDFVEEKICVVPHHGPIMQAGGFSDDELANPALPCVDPSRGGGALSVRWTGHAETHELQAFLDLNKATSVQEAKAALSHFSVGAQNWVMADTAGDILYYPHAVVPVRDNAQTYPPYLPVPGQGQAEWIGQLSAAELPQALNPAAGFIVTANNDQAGGTADGDPLNDPNYLLATPDLGLRAGRITRRLAALAPEGVSAEEVVALQGDQHWEYAERLVPHLLSAADALPGEVSGRGLEALVARLRAWDFSAPTGLSTTDPTGPASLDAKARADAVAASLFAAWHFNAIDLAFADELRAGGVISGDKAPFNQNLEKALYFELEAGREALFDKVHTAPVEGRDLVLIEALELGARDLQARLGADPEAWLWGRLHVVPFPSPLGLNGLPDGWEMRTVAKGGGHHTVDVGPYHRDFTNTHGATMRMVTELHEGQLWSRRVQAGGVLANRGEANREDQIELWATGQLKESPFTLEAAVEAAKARQAQGLAPGARWHFAEAAAAQ